jgi:uroporphyrinogen-III synthase
MSERARPLRVLVTRAAHQASALAEALRMVGCEPVEIPAIELVPPASWEALDAALAELYRFDWLLFTSANAVAAFLQRSKGAALPASLRVGAIGAATARALEEAGLRVDLVPPQAVAESFATALLPFARQADGTPGRFLLVRAEEAREHLPDALRGAGAEVTVAPAYRNVVPEASVASIRQLFADGGADAVAFTSSSSVWNLKALLERAGCELPAGVACVSIGPVTSDALREVGWAIAAGALEPSVRALAEACAALRISTAR